MKRQRPAAFFWGCSVRKTDFGLRVVLVVHAHGEKTAIRGPAGSMTMREIMKRFYRVLHTDYLREIPIKSAGQFCTIGRPGEHPQSVWQRDTEPFLRANNRQ